MDGRTARYARLLPIPTLRRKLAPVNTAQLAHMIEQAARCSVYNLYSVIYQSEALNRLTASKVYPTETLRAYLLSIANWVLFLLRTRPVTPSSAAAAALAGDPGATPGPVEMEDPGDNNEPSALW